jgi:uncharacterized protein (TIGR02118 family)
VIYSLATSESSIRSYIIIASLYFESQEALGAALQSPEGHAAAADVQNFATGGVTMLAGGVQVYDPVSLG